MVTYQDVYESAKTGTGIAALVYGGYSIYKGVTAPPTLKPSYNPAYDIKRASKAADDLPSGWTKTTNNGFTHIRDANGNIRVRIDSPDAKTQYLHKHIYDELGNSLDVNGNIVSPKSPDAHIPLK